MEQIKPGLFSVQVAADFRRAEFDGKNEQILAAGVHPDLVFIGDSITHGWELGLHFGEFGMVLNRGIGGDTPFYIEKRFAADALQLNPKRVVMLCGINETWGLDQAGAEAERAELAAGMLEKIVNPIQAMAAACAGQSVPLLLCSILPTYGEGTGAAARKALVIAANAKLRGVGARYVDFHSAMVDADGRTLRAELSPDGCHPNAAGYRLMADVLKEELAR